MIAQSDDIVRAALVRLMKARGWDMDVVSTVEEVIGVADRFDIILSGWEFDDGTGNEIISQTSTPVVFHTRSPREAAAKYGFDITLRPALIQTIQYRLRKAVAA